MHISAFSFPKTQNSLQSQKILDEYDLSLNFKDYCNNIVSKIGPTISDWRKYFIKEPKLYNSAKQDYVFYWYSEKSNPELSLISKTIWSSIHEEYFTKYLYIKNNTNPDFTVEYLNSHKDHQFSTVFTKINSQNEFSIKFIPIEREGNSAGNYVVSTNFVAPKVEDLNFTKNSENNRMEKFFKSEERDEIEKLINVLLQVT